MNLNRKLTEVPKEYFSSPEHKGTVDKMFYTTVNYTTGEPMEKYLYVYVPYGYDESKKYNVWYYTHGGHETCDKYIYDNGDDNAFKCFLDNMIEKGEIEPTIFAFPCFYLDNTISDDQDPVELSGVYYKELVGSIMPTVENKYSTYAESTDYEGIKASREHRYLSGWSMGSSCTWFTFVNALDCAKYYAITSGDCWMLGKFASTTMAEETAKAMAEAVKKQGYGLGDYYLYIPTGSDDIAYAPLKKMVPEMLVQKEAFVMEGPDQNLSFHVWPAGEHHTKWRLQYIYNAVLAFLGK